MPLDPRGFIDWAAALRRGIVKPVDAIEGIAERRAPMKIDRDLEFEASGTWMNDVTFSHRKHVQWTGCELCHPEVFPVTKSGSVKMRMKDIWAGQYCGACHRSVAFRLDACRRCHRGESSRQLRP